MFKIKNKKLEVISETKKKIIYLLTIDTFNLFIYIYRCYLNRNCSTSSCGRRYTILSFLVLSIWILASELQ